MILSIQQLSEESTVRHARRFEVHEQVCPPRVDERTADPVPCPGESASAASTNS